VLAQAVIDVLAVAGVPVTDIDFAHLRARDTLNAHPPALVEAMLQLIAPFATHFRVSRVARASAAAEVVRLGVDLLEHELTGQHPFLPRLVLGLARMELWHHLAREQLE
jgi:hypothetical protein